MAKTVAQLQSELAQAQAAEIAAQSKATPAPHKETVEEQIARLTAENAALRASKAGGGGAFSVKMGPKGTFVITGFGRYPFSPYPSQWKRFMDALPGIQEQIKALDAAGKVSWDKKIE